MLKEIKSRKLDALSFKQAGKLTAACQELLKAKNMEAQMATNDDPCH